MNYDIDKVYYKNKNTQDIYCSSDNVDDVIYKMNQLAIMKDFLY
jgi:uncharacterized protein YlbG (UPF0298 family)